MQCRGIRPHFEASQKFHGYSRVAAGTWGITQVTAGVAIQNSCFFSFVRTPVYLGGTRQESPEAWQGNTDASQGEGIDLGSLSS